MDKKKKKLNASVYDIHDSHMLTVKQAEQNSDKTMIGTTQYILPTQGTKGQNSGNYKHQNMKQHKYENRISSVKEKY